MKTRGQEMLDIFDGALRRLDALRLAHYEEAEVRAIVIELGSRLERFFKSAVWPGALGAETLDTLINRLKSVGFDRAGRQQLSAFRIIYNDAKHDPFVSVQLKRAADVTLSARQAVSALISTGVGTTTAPIEKAVNRLLWVSGYDVYVGGVTEVYVSLPLPEDLFATHIDVVWVKGTSWDLMKADLIATGCFFYGAEHFAPDVYDRFKEGDFINAGVWDGDYRLLVDILSRYEDRPIADELIPSLRRDHMWPAVLSSLALAAIDVARASPTLLAAQQLTHAILKKADKTYAMPSARPWVATAAETLAEMIAQVPFGDWRELSGPYWNMGQPQELRSKITSPDVKIGYVIDETNRIVMV
jgi:hypothetical protein